MRIPRPVRTVIKRILMLPCLAWVSAFVLIRSTRLIHRATVPDKNVILVFDSHRWTQDISALARPGKLDIYAVDDAVIGRINGWFRLEDRVAGTDYFNARYFSEDRPAFLAQRKRHAEFVTTVMGYVKSWLKIECACTCAIYYFRLFPWMIAAQNVDMPFVVIHKELAIVDREHLLAVREHWRSSNFQFFCSHLCVPNQIEFDLFSNLGTAPVANISNVGLLRSDDLFVQPPRRRVHSDPAREGRVITLFSFGHTTGLERGVFDISDDELQSQFSKRDRVGFRELFRDVHVSLAELAIRHPDVEFNIKPRLSARGWFEEIRKVIVENLGLSLDDIPNCNIVDRPALELISGSDASIAFNSTVMLESRILGTNTITPFFAEASEKYADHIHFKEFFDTFSVAHSREEFVGMIERAIDGEKLVAENPERVDALCEHYLGNKDGTAAERTIKVIQDDIAKFANNANM